MGNNRSMLDQLRGMRNRKLNPAIKPVAPLNLDRIREAVKMDQGIPGNQKTSVLSSLADPEFVAELRSGATGAGLMYLITKYLNLGQKTQLLVSIAGFGLGKMLYDYRHDPKNFSQYNANTKMYEITNV